MGVKPSNRIQPAFCEDFIKSFTLEYCTTTALDYNGIIEIPKLLYLNLFTRL